MLALFDNRALRACVLLLRNKNMGLSHNGRNVAGDVLDHNVPCLKLQEQARDEHLLRFFSSRVFFDQFCSVPFSVIARSGHCNKAKVSKIRRPFPYRCRILRIWQDRCIWPCGRAPFGLRRCWPGLLSRSSKAVPARPVRRKS